jgi:hypothetical protein
MIRHCEEFEENALREGVTKEDIASILLGIAAAPIKGERVCSLYGDLGILPGAGFFINEWPICASRGGRTLAYSLHLFVSECFPIIAYDFTTAEYRHLPWLTYEARMRLQKAGRLIHQELTPAYGE